MFRSLPKRVSELSISFWRGFLRQDKPNSRCGCDWFSGLHAVIFRVIAASDLWGEGRVLAKNRRVPEVSAVGLETQREAKCEQKKEGSEV